MAYYKKEEVKKYIEENNQIIQKNNIKPLTPIEQPLSQLQNEEDIVGFFWVNFDDNGNGNVEIQMDGKAFLRIDHDLYTDDQFALDLYQAQSERKNVEQVIRERIENTEKAKTTISPDQQQKEANKLQSAISDALKNKENHDTRTDGGAKES